MLNDNSQKAEPVCMQGFAMPVVIAIIVLVLVIGGVIYFTTKQQPATNNEVMKNEVIKKDTSTGVVLAGKSAPLLDFTRADYDAAIKSDKLVVLYFYANWCPICKEEIANALYPAFNELTTDKVIGIRVNYKDSDTDEDEKNLARQYGIPYQHTKVFIKNGQQILKAPDGWDKARYLTEINNALAQ
jgi:thiol-disulfide isomerase/thioredoxin